MVKRIVRIALDVLSLLILLGTVIFLIVYWKHIPDMVPIHFDARGQIDGLGGKMSLLMLPVLAAALFVTLSFAKTVRYRSMGKQVYVPAPELMFPAMKLALTAGFSYMTICGALVRPLGIWFLPVFLILIFAPMVGYGLFVLPKLR